MRSLLPKVTALVIAQAAFLVLQPSTSHAAISLTNGSFETTGALYNGALGGLYEATGWTNLTGLDFQASSAPADGGVNGEYPAALNGQTDGARYLRLVADSSTPGNRASIAQLVGNMTAGETYRLRGDVIGGPGGGVDYGATFSFVSNISLTPTTVYKTQTVSGVANGIYLSDAFDFSYTATAADAGQPLVVFLQAPVIADGTATRGGVDDLRLTTVPEPSSALLAAAALGSLSFMRRRRR